MRFFNIRNGVANEVLLVEDFFSGMYVHQANRLQVLEN